MRQLFIVGVLVVLVMLAVGAVLAMDVFGPVSGGQYMWQQISTVPVPPVTPTNKMTIRFAGYTKAGTLTNFPALVELVDGTAGVFYYTNASASGYDLRFSNSTETVELNYEIESWNTNGTSYLWVQVPTLVDTNTYIWAYWNGAGTQQPYTTNGATWSSDYIAVWHLNQTNALDSTANKFHGTAKGSVTQVADQNINGVDSFDPDADYISVPDNVRFTLTNNYSVSCWIKPDVGVDVYTFLGGYAAGKGGWMFGIESVTNLLTFWDGGTWRSSSYTIPDGIWSHAVYTRIGVTNRFYVNGVQVSSALTGVNSQDSGNLEIGGGGSAYSSYRWDGMLDEANIVAATLSSNWIWAAWMNTGSNSIFNSYTTTL